MTDMTSPHAVREDQDGIAIVTFNRPEKLNAITKSMRAVLFQAIEDLRDRGDLRILLIRAKGKYFTSGVDISEPLPGTTTAGKTMFEIRRDYRRPLHINLDEIENIEKPVVMAVQGTCLGLGVEIAGACDFRLAAESASFGLPEINIGLVAGSGGISRFTRICGTGWAKWLSMAGERIDARTAMIAGFVQAIYPDEEFEDATLAFCRRLLTKPAEVQAAAKLAIELAYDLDKSSARHVERLVNTPLMMRDRSAMISAVLNRGKKRN